MKAGRELDALVAEKVMGWEWYAIIGINVLVPPEHYLRERPILATPGKHGAETDIDSYRFADSTQGRQMPIVARYSTDIAAAWQVVDELHKRGFCVGVSTLHDWKTKCECSVYYADMAERMVANADAATASHAICLAALKAMEGAK